MKQEGLLIDELIQLLRRGNAHISTDDALAGIPFSKINTAVNNIPYTIWDLATHLRIAQWDIVEFCKSPHHQSPEWPSGYWPDNKATSEKQWEQCIQKIHSDREEMISLLLEAGKNLFTPFPYGTGQSLFREALVLADHNSYHTGEIIALRRILGIWR
ncbi:MAG: DinB family protein [Chitinophagaceae bacterium]|nr:DinB family protein [Chitinophagaceae bacterium]MCW5914971.1 DinB family protein [Chitinophagaceae bacterium]MCZ2396760.1 DinB family protein [Chitinophagales bacterium]